jgi:hypothetical protein
VAGTAALAGGTAAAGGVVAAGTAVDGGEADTTAVVGTGMPGTIDGTAAGVGGAAVGIRGGSFRYRCLFLIRITGGITVQDMGMGMGMGMGMDRVTGTDTDRGSSRSPGGTERKRPDDQPGSPGTWRDRT